MQVVPTREEFLRLSRQGNVVPVRADLLADLETPVSAYAKLRGPGPAFLLESVEGGGKRVALQFHRLQSAQNSPGDARHP
jgi:hypothetical protein